MLRLKLLLAATLILIVALPRTSTAQTAAATSQTAASAPSAPDGGVPTFIRPETPEQRKNRLGTAEDPGVDPDPSKHFWRFGKSYHIEKFDRRWASFDNVEEGWVRPFARVSAIRELYQQNDKYVWVWSPDLSAASEAPAPPPSTPAKYDEKQVAVLRGLVPEFSALTPEKSDTTIRFEKASNGLPTSGSWRNSPAVADMNGDGNADLVLPPERAGDGLPRIFLGDGKGHWQFWQEVKWPRRIDYGSVVAADFNRDGHMDLAFAVHLNGVAVMLGDGKGNFIDSSKGLPLDFPTRRLAVIDADHDGYPDLAVLSEGPTVRGAMTENYAKLRVYLNENKGKSWRGMNVTDPRRAFGGDWLAVGDFNGDKYPDFSTASLFFGSGETLYTSTGPKQWKVVDTPGVVPFYSSYFATAAGKFTSANRDDVIVSFVRAWPKDLDTMVLRTPTMTEVTGIDRITFTGKQPKRVPIVRWGTTHAITGLAAGDLDGDGKLDVIYTRTDPRQAVILLGDGKGGFRSAQIEGLTVEPLTNYDVTVADVNGDGRPDVILMYESAEATASGPRNGSAEVFLNMGTTGSAAK